MSAVPVPDEATWLALRDQNVGGSEVACLFYRWLHPDGTEAVHHLYEAPPEGSTLLGCLSPFKSGYRLWQEKAGKLMPDDLSGVERVQAGNYLEPALAEWAKSKWDWKLRKVRRYCTHEGVVGWGASLDYEVQEKGLPPVEFKNIDGLQFRDKWVAEGGEIIMPPLHYVLQLQHQIGAVGASHGWVVCCISGNELVRGRIERHDSTQAKIAEAIEAFWQGVNGGIEPTWLADYETVAEEYRYGDDFMPADLTGDAELPALIEQYLEVKARINGEEVTLENLKGQIAARVGEATKAKADGYRLSWPRIERAEKVIPEKVQKAMTYRGALTITPIKD